jgi:hypothetical protein
MVQDPTIPGGIGYGRLQDITWPPEPIPCTPDMTKTDPCAGCAWRENLLRDGVYVGDTPCTWCNKNKFNTITSTQSSLADYETTVSELETHLTGTKCNCGDNAICSKCSGSASTTTLLNFDVKESDKITCLCQGDIWNTCGCKAECFSGSSTEAAVEAAQASCNHCIDQVSKSITDKV